MVQHCKSEQFFILPSPFVQDGEKIQWFENVLVQQSKFLITELFRILSQSTVAFHDGRINARTRSALNTISSLDDLRRACRWQARQPPAVFDAFYHLHLQYGIEP